MSFFTKATKKQMKLRLALIGPSGSGKTMSALRIARGMGCKRIAVCDTENGSSQLYADQILEGGENFGPLEFDVVVMSPPYSVEKYLRAMNEAASHGYDCLIIDSLSHAWAGEGGILQTKEALDARGGNSFTNWGKLTPLQEKLKTAVLRNQTHLICTMRTKTEYVMESNDKGKQAPKKVGTAPVQREGFEYEFDLVLECAMDNLATPSKDRTSMFKGQFFLCDESTGSKLKNWLDSGAKGRDEEQCPPANQDVTSAKENSSTKTEAPSQLPPTPSASTSSQSPKSSFADRGKSRSANNASANTSQDSSLKSKNNTPPNTSPKNGTLKNLENGQQPQDNTLAPGFDPQGDFDGNIGEFALEFKIGNHPKGKKLKEFTAEALHDEYKKLRKVIYDKYDAGEKVPETWNVLSDKIEEFLGIDPVKGIPQ
jgi:hypothetical protein